MVDHGVGILHLLQRRAFVPRLPAGLLARRLAQARAALRSLQPITRRRLATGGAVQPQPSLKLFHSLQQRVNHRVFLLAAELAQVRPLHHTQLQSYFPPFANPSGQKGAGELPLMEVKIFLRSASVKWQTSSNM